MLAWLDLETTGLEPKDCKILELAMVITDNALNEIATFERVLHAPIETQLSADPFVQKMHTANGLWLECARSQVSVEDAEISAAAFLTKHTPPDFAGKPLLCGSTIGFDRSFLKEHMPFLAGRFHYRSIDVTSVNECAARFLPDIYAERPTGEPAHRALADIRSSLDMLRWHRRHSFMAETP